MSVLSNIVKVRCMHFWSDWTEIKDIEINVDEFIFFEVDYRGEDSWHIIGHRGNENHEWKGTELSDHQVASIYDLAEFISKVNSCDNGKYQPCKVSRFNNLHYSDSFYQELQSLLALVEKKMLSARLRKEN